MKKKQPTPSYYNFDDSTEATPRFPPTRYVPHYPTQKTISSTRILYPFPTNRFFDVRDFASKFDAKDFKFGSQIW